VGQNELPQNYQPEPFMVPIPESTPSEFDDEFSNSRPFSPFTPGTRTSFYTTSSAPDMASTMGLNAGGLVNGDSSVGRKGGAPRPMRAVNIIQHHDAGPNTNGEREDEPETIELPPAYTMVRRAGGSGSGGSGGDDGDGPSSSANTWNEDGKGLHEEGFLYPLATCFFFFPSPFLFVLIIVCIKKTILYLVLLSLSPISQIFALLLYFTFSLLILIQNRTFFFYKKVFLLLFFCICWQF
jgi:hypothetical protein